MHAADLALERSKKFKALSSNAQLTRHDVRRAW